VFVIVLRFSCAQGNAFKSDRDDRGEIYRRTVHCAVRSGLGDTSVYAPVGEAVKRGCTIEGALSRLPEPLKHAIFLQRDRRIFELSRPIARH